MKKCLVAALFLLSSCACEDDNINKVCLIGSPCSVNEDGSYFILFDPPELVGECRWGTVTGCNGDEIICDGVQKPTIEICDGKDNDCDGKTDFSWQNPTILEICDNIDNDCDGVVDDFEEECWTGNSNVVFNENSACKKGTKHCFEGTWTPCKNETKPTMEICDGVDNNCNGETDEKNIRSCGPNFELGACKYGDNVCIDGDMICIGAVREQPEICDGIDNNCNGATDENLFRLCSSKCGDGVETCSNGFWAGCTATQPTSEICDGVDNDCDGEIDEECSCVDGQTSVCYDFIDPRTTRTATCGIGIKLCMAGEWSLCQPYGVLPEFCNNWDDDCDGQIDGIVQECGSVPRSGVGQCINGSKSCESGTWTPCLGSVGPEREKCDNIDNDCDGETDEGLNPHEKVDMWFFVDDSGSMCDFYRAFQIAFGFYIQDFRGTDHRFGLVSFPGHRPEHYSILAPLSDVDTFAAALNALNCSGNGFEPSYDIMYYFSDPRSPLGWRNDAYPYLVMITDEPAQSYSQTDDYMVGSRTSYCQVGMCSLNDKYEVYVITGSENFYQWIDTVYGETDRLFDIHPIDPSYYLDIFQTIFSNICI